MGGAVHRETERERQSSSSDCRCRGLTKWTTGPPPCRCLEVRFHLAARPRLSTVWGLVTTTAKCSSPKIMRNAIMDVSDQGQHITHSHIHGSNMEELFRQ